MPLLSGAFVHAEIDGPLIRDVVTLPRAALVDGHVFVVNEAEQQVRRIPVRVERTLRERVALRDVPAGSLVVLTNLDVLADGMPVRVAEPSAATLARDADRPPAPARETSAGSGQAVP